MVDKTIIPIFQTLSNQVQRFKRTYVRRDITDNEVTKFCNFLVIIIPRIYYYKTPNYPNCLIKIL